MKRSWIVEKREAFYELSVTKESEKLKMKLLFTSRRPPACSHADSTNTGNTCACNTKASLKNARKGPQAVWSASSGATENLNGSREGTVSFPLSQSLVLNIMPQPVLKGSTHQFVRSGL